MKETKIQWTDHTWNPWHGCSKVSSGCKFCYMFRDKDRFNLNPTSVVRSRSKFREPLKWKDPAKVFTCSWSDFFIEDADSWREEAWKIIKMTPHLTYQILTKRPERILNNLPEDWEAGYHNVWLGVSVEDHSAALQRIPILLNIPSKLRFISAEPLLESIVSPDTFPLLLNLDWIIVGGESGNSSGKWNYRQTKLEWISELLNLNDRVPVFLKQLGTYLAKMNSMNDRSGGDPNEWESIYRVQCYPSFALGGELDSGL